jgi:NADH-quinone oxidoreductase subunit E
MLSPEERQEIEAELPHYPNKQAVCIDAMKIVQRHRGWVSDESIRDIADFLGISADDLDGVATFYNLIYRKPVGRHVILLCNSVSCWIMGYERLRERLCQRLQIQLGETTADGRFTLLPIVCLGTCDHAPALMIDNHLHRDLSPDSAEQLLESYRQP